MKPLLIFILSAIYPCIAFAEGNIQIGEAELIYTDEQLPFIMDVSFATLKESDNQMSFFRCGDWYKENYRYCGTLDEPLKVRQWKKKDPNDSFWDYNGWYSGWHWAYPWIANCYKISENELLGFVHVEKMTCGPKFGCDHYAIGLGYSSDNGDSWKYCGEIVKPQNDKGNIGGVPYIVKGKWFYVYYNELPQNGPRRICAARSKVRDVVETARKGKCSLWMKYNNGKWHEKGLSGVGGNIIPTMISQWPHTYDVHSDAAYCRGLGKYLLTVQTHSLGKLLLFTSKDGINWSKPITIDGTGKDTYWHAYSFFAALDDATDDCREVGSDFYIYYPRKKYNKYDIDKFYRRRIIIKK